MRLAWERPRVLPSVPRSRPGRLNTTVPSHIRSDGAQIVVCARDFG